MLCVAWTHALLQVSPELSAVVSQLQRVQPGMMSSTLAMADALEALTVTRWEAWAGLLMELSVETNRKLLSLRVGGVQKAASACACVCVSEYALKICRVCVFVAMSAVQVAC